MKSFNFKITAKSTECLAKTGIFSTPHGDIQTPVFMPVGTKAGVKTLSSEDLVDLGAEIILSNTYHLFLRPGDELVKEMGGLHKWMNWQRPILTDSGGYQVFSLGQKKSYGKTKNAGVKIDDNGVKFKSHLDGSTHYITPEKATEIQHNLGADIIMAFDECAPADSTEKYFEQAMKRTHDWVIKCKKTHEELNAKQEVPQALFPIVQGGLFPKLRAESAKFMNDLDMPGNAIGGLSVGETKEEMIAMIEAAIPHLTDQKPRYLMGVGTPEDLIYCVEQGIDMFDCVHPTRLARHGGFWNEFGRFNIKNEKFRKEQKPLQEGCNCLSCKSYSASYIRHLFVENEIGALRLLTIHNLHFLLNLMQEIREAIKNDTFIRFKTDFFHKFNPSNS